MVSNFNVKYQEAQELLTDYSSYRVDVLSAARGLGLQVDALSCLDSFEGAGAESIKLYFSETHLLLLASLEGLAEQLVTDYAAQYYAKFEESPISEADDQAQWPSSVMEAAEKKLQGIREGDVADAAKALQTAAACIPDGMSFNIPSSANVEERLTNEETAIEKVRSGVESAEASGAAAFAKRGTDFQALASALSAAIARCASGAVSMTDYEAGAFSAIAEDCGLGDAYDRCHEYQAENAAITISCQKDAINKEQIRIQEEAEKAAEEKEFWAKFGVAASALALIGTAAAVVATVTTFGAGTPLLVMSLNVAAGAIGAATAAGDLKDRLDQLGEMQSDAGADVPESNDCVDFGVGATRTGLKAGALDVEGEMYISEGKFWYAAGEATENELEKVYGMGSMAEGFSKKINAGKKVGGFLVEQIVDAGIDVIPDEGVKTTAKTGKEIGVGASDVAGIIRDNGSIGLKGSASIVSTVGKCGTVVADYNIDVADQKIESCDNRLDELDGLISDIDSLANRGLLCCAW